MLLHIKEKIIRFNKSTLGSFYEDYFETFRIIGNGVYPSKSIEGDEILEVNIGYGDCMKKLLIVQGKYFMMIFFSVAIQTLDIFKKHKLQVIKVSHIERRMTG